MPIPPVSAIQHHMSIRALSVSRELLPQISVGEMLEAAVLEKCGSDRYLLSLKNMTVLARSEAALSTGERIQVRVEQLLPEITLALLDAKGGREVSPDYVRWYRSNPESLKIMFLQLVEQLQTGVIQRFPGTVAANDTQAILKLAESLLFSGKTSGQGLFIRDYMENLGLLWEGSLRKATAHDRKNIETRNQGLKGALMALAGQLREGMETRGLSAAAGAEMQNLVEFLDTSVKTIEAQQIINVVCQESEKGWILQIPFVFPEGLRMGDILVRRDSPQGGSAPGEESFEVVFLLDMDALGQIVVEAKMRSGRVGCLIRCESGDVRDFITGALGELEQALGGIGLRVETMGCVNEADLPAWSRQYYWDRVCQEDVVNLFV